MLIVSDHDLFLYNFSNLHEPVAWIEKKIIYLRKYFIKISFQINGRNFIIFKIIVILIIAMFSHNILWFLWWLLPDHLNFFYLNYSLIYQGSPILRFMTEKLLIIVNQINFTIFFEKFHWQSLFYGREISGYILQNLRIWLEKLLPRPLHHDCLCNELRKSCPFPLVWSCNKESPVFQFSMGNKLSNCDCECYVHFLFTSASNLQVLFENKIFQQLVF